MIRVLESFSALKPTTNPYLVQLASVLDDRPEVELSSFSYRRGIFGRYDIFHVHWPELLVGGHRASGRAARRILAMLFLLRLRLTRTAVVRTWHNVEPPRGLAPIDYRFLRALDRLVSVRIRLNDMSEPPDGKPVVTIPHGHYREWFARFPIQEPVTGKLAFVGLIRQYKGVEDLITAFRQIPQQALRLEIHGRPTSQEVAGEVARLAAGDPRIMLDLRFLEEADLVKAVTSASLLVLPYHHMHNSGTVLASLSLCRPLLVPDTEVNRRLAEEVGPGWIHTYTGDLQPERIVEIMQSLPTLTTAPPDLSARDWRDTGSRHVAVFERAISTRRASRLRWWRG